MRLTEGLNLMQETSAIKRLFNCFSANIYRMLKFDAITRSAVL
jgi:hypothetical protein